MSVPLHQAKADTFGTLSHRKILLCLSEARSEFEAEQTVTTD